MLENVLGDQVVQIYWEGFGEIGRFDGVFWMVERLVWESGERNRSLVGFWFRVDLGCIVLF